MKNSLKINAISNWGSLVVNIVVGFWVTRFITRTLGTTGYGIWTLVGSFVGYYGLLNLGIRSAVTRYIARYSSQRDAKALNQVASTAMSVFCVTGVIVILISFFLAGPLSRFFELADGDSTQFIHVVWIMGVTTSVAFVGIVFSSALVAREHFVVVNIVTIIWTVLRGLLIVLFVRAGWGIVGVGLSPLVCTTLAFVVDMVLFRRYAGDIRIRPAFVSGRMLKALVAFGGATVIIMVADLLRNQIDSFVIGRFVSISAVGIYGSANILRQYMARVVSSGMAVLSPRFSAMDGVGQHVQKQHLLLRSLVVSSFLAFWGGMLLEVWGGHFILLWLGPDYEGAIVILHILVVASAIGVAQTPSIPYMYATNRHIYYAVASIVEGICNLLLSLLLVVKYGMIGVALGTLITMLVNKVVVMPIYMSKIANVPWWQYVRSVLYPALVALVIVLVSRALGIQARPKCTFLYFLCGCAVVTIVYVAGCFALLPSELRGFIKLPRRKRVVPEG